MTKVAGFESPMWTARSGVTSVSVVALKLESGAWKVQAPYDGAAFVVDDDRMSAAMGVAAEMMRMAREDDAQLPDMLSVLFVDENIKPERHRVVDMIGCGFPSLKDKVTEPCDHEWNPAWTAFQRMGKKPA